MQGKVLGGEIIRLVILGTKICLTVEVLTEQFCNSEMGEFCSALKESDEMKGKHKHVCDFQFIMRASIARAILSGI